MASCDGRAANWSPVSEGMPIIPSTGALFGRLFDLAPSRMAQQQARDRMLIFLIFKDVEKYREVSGYEKPHSKQ